MLWPRRTGHFVFRSNSCYRMPGAAPSRHRGVATLSPHELRRAATDSLAQLALQSSINFLSSSLRAPDKQLSGWTAGGESGSGPSKHYFVSPCQSSSLQLLLPRTKGDSWNGFQMQAPPSLPVTPISVPAAAAFCRCLCQPGHTLRKSSIIIEKRPSTAGRKILLSPHFNYFPFSSKEMKNNSAHKELF